MDLEPLKDKWESFGFEVSEVNGHDVKKIYKNFLKFKSSKSKKPSLTICHTIKGKGFKFAENNPFFTEYQISKEIYTTLLTISNKQKDYKDLMHYPFINDLIQKGILRVKYKNLNNSEDTIKTKVNKVVKDTIVEMETKTTPTCLTSYLKQ